ncbi:Protein ELC [Raphanus sativus]|nr:Protein ELC [Raphanus sativus]
MNHDKLFARLTIHVARYYWIIQQFLSSVLSQRGPNSVPYDESTKWLIRQHLLNLISSYPSLEPKTATFIHNDGRSVNLLQSDGTIPMPYHGVTYNIPVIIWLLESYPRHPPCVYVNPTADMIIKRPHAHVTPSGLVSLPYLQNWVYPSSNLVDLVSDLGSAFARDPPLYSRRRPQPTPPPSYDSSLTRPPPPPTPTADQSLARPFPPSPYGRVQHVHHQQQQQHRTTRRRFTRETRSTRWWRWSTAISPRCGETEKPRRSRC